MNGKRLRGRSGPTQCSRADDDDNNDDEDGDDDDDDMCRKVKT
jgi:hypothetical protein